MSKKILIKCDEATSICDKTQYGAASRFDKFRLSIHNFLCHRCKLYSEQNALMTKIFKVNKQKCTEHNLCTSDKDVMKDAIKKETSIK